MFSPSSAVSFARQSVRAARNIWVRGIDQARQPVVVYQMGKVGSSSVRDSLRSHGVWPVSHAHRINPTHVEEIKKERARRGLDPLLPAHHQRGLELYDEIIEPKRPAKFISLVREPVSRNISAFFFNYVTEKDSWEDLSLRKILDSFLSEYPHEVPLVWFDRETKVTLGIDVYDTSFPTDRGYLKLRNGPFELLVMRTELPDPRKADAIEQFLGISGFEVERRNTGKKKEYAELYAQFKREVSLPDSYLDRMLRSQYAQHFYSSQEIEQAYSRWS